MTGEWARAMGLAVREAGKGYGRTGPNPRVGAVLLADGQVISTGYHEEVGGPHAEVMAVERAAGRARGADLVVTLEPCSRFGRTPPCTDLIIRSGIRRVIAGTLDPNPAEHGRGAQVLEQQGIAVTVGVEERRCRELIEPYAKLITAGRPFVTLKLAASLDGRIATATGDARWISSVPFQHFVHRLRRDSNAVMVGGGTVAMDDPELTVRMAAPRTRPLRVVVSSGLDLSEQLEVFRDQERVPTLVLCARGRSRKAEARLKAQGVQVVVCGAGRRVDLGSALDELGRRGVSSVLVEGGSVLAGGLLERKLVDRLIIGYGPVVVGSRGRPLAEMKGAPVLADVERHRVEWVRSMGADVVLSVRVGPDWTQKAWQHVDK